MEDPTAVISEGKTVDTEVNSMMFNLFVDDKNIKRNVVLPLSNINSQIIINNERFDNLGERYMYTLNANSAYARTFEKMQNIKIEINGCKTKEQTAEWLTTTKDNTVVSLNKSICANPWAPGLLRHHTDPLNCCFATNNINLGSAQTDTTITLTPTLVDKLRRLESNQDTLRHYYNGLLKPERQNLNYKVNSGLVSFLSGRPVNQETGEMIMQDTAHYGIMSSFTSINNLMNMPDFVQPVFDNAVYKFSKGVPSKNWIYTPSANPTSSGSFSEDPAPATTELYTFYVGNIPVPTNVKGLDEYFKLKDPGGLAPILWYCDKHKQISTPPVDGATIKPSGNEPDGQTLNITIEIKNVTSPILHPILETLQTSSFTNIIQFKLDAIYQNDLYANMFFNMWKPGSNESLGTAKVSLSESKLRITQFDMSILENSIKPRVKVSYNYFREYPLTKQVHVQKSADGKMVGFQKTRFNIPVTFDGIVPRYTLICVSSAKNLPSKFSYFNMNFAGQSNVIMQSINELVNASRQNGLYLTSYDQYNNYHVLSKYNNQKIVPAQCGPVLYLEYGDNIPIIHSTNKPLTAGSLVSGLQVTYDIEVDGMFETDIDVPLGDHNLTVHVFHVNEKDIVFTNNQCETSIPGFGLAQIAESVKAVQEVSASNDLTMNASDFIQGGAKNLKKIRKVNKATTTTQPSTTQPSSQPQTNRVSMQDFILRR